MAGFRPLLFSELNAHARQTFSRNLATKETHEVGDIADLTTRKLAGLREEWGADTNAIDLVSGGPPCQGFSGIGHRRSHAVERADTPANLLYKKMIKVIDALEPKFFLFENVRGLLTGRWTAGGASGEIWRDVRREFASLRKYELGWQLVYAGDYGVPQRRPRIILVGAHRDLGLSLDAPTDSATNNPRGLIPLATMGAPNLTDVLGDLIDPHYLSKSVTARYLKPARTPYQVQMRTRPDGKVLNVGDALLEMEYTRHSPKIIRKFQLMLEGKPVPKNLSSRKFAQRVLPARWETGSPTITATSLPDDFVHFKQPRILTVREWARLQMFPDWYEFFGPRTTGGHRRAGIPTLGLWDREVPKYTQIGNAVPVGLATALGKHIAALLVNSTRRR